MQKTLHEIREKCKEKIPRINGNRYSRPYDNLFEDIREVFQLQEARLRRIEELNLNEHQGDPRKIFLTVKD